MLLLVAKKNIDNKVESRQTFCHLPRDLSGAEILFPSFKIEFTYFLIIVPLWCYYDATSSGSVVNTKDCPSSPALTITVPCNPNEAAKTAALCPVCVEIRVPVRASHVLMVLSADADTNKCDFGAEGVRREVMASCQK